MLWSFSFSQHTIFNVLTCFFGCPVTFGFYKKLLSRRVKEISLKCDAKIVVEAGAELTLKAGGSFVKVDAGGVHIVGPAINLNAGGSAGSGSTYGGLLTAAPRNQ